MARPHNLKTAYDQPPIEKFKPTPGSGIIAPLTYRQQLMRYALAHSKETCVIVSKFNPSAERKGISFGSKKA